MSIPTRNYIYGLSPLKRENPVRGQSEWYYFDPRNASTFSDFKQIDVPSQNTPNPYAKEIQNYIFKTDSDNYKLLYGNAQPPQENQQNQPQQPENNTAKPIFSNQQNNQIFSQPQNAAGQAIGNNVEQSSQASVQNLNGTIKSIMPKATLNAQNMNYIEQIKNILGDGGKDTQSILGTLPNIDNARSYTTDNGGIVYDVKPTIVHKEDKDNNEITAGLTYENYYKLLEHLRGIKNDKGDYVGGIEGYAGYPYLDTEGKNTVCTGNLIDENNTSKYPYTNIDTGKPSMDIREWSFRQSASYYHCLNEEYILISDKYTVDDGYRLTKELLKKDRLPSALCVASDTLAVGVLQALNEGGIQVPEQIAVFSINDVNVAKYLSPPLTTIHIDIPCICETALDLLRNRVLYGSRVTKLVFVNGTPIFRKSC